ncbi:MAG TPA: CHAT domain-containing protein [Planctomycetota bacterium]|nr:CHAT domain-containing protein [Planctomycetota bacterium]
MLARARKASGKLLTPAVKQLLQGWTQLTVADYGMLGGLPWECLELSPGVLLGEQIAVNTLTSLPLGVMLKRDRYRPGPAAKARIHLVATLSGSPLLIDAKAKVVRSIDRDSVMRLAKPYSGHDELLNGEATLERVASTSFGDQVTHFLTHGAQRGAERPAGLALSPARRDDDGFFGSDAAEKLAVSGLVVISACGAGRGHPRVGDEVLHATLGGAFLRAGAHTIVQTSADLHLHAHLRLMELVHAMIADATAPAVALRDARARIARSADLVERFEHAQVQVFGLGHLPVVVR